MNDIYTLNNGVEIPCIGFGVWQLSPGSQTEECVKIAFEAGYRHIDTASFYGNEGSVGDAFRQSGLDRSEVFVTTKLWNDDQREPEKAFDKSIEKLGIDYVDLYLIHWPLAKTRDSAWKALEGFYDSKRVRAIGVSNYTIEHLEKLSRDSAIVPAVNQVEFSPFLYQRELLEYCKSKSIQLVAYSPLARAKKFGNDTLANIAGRYNKSQAQIMLRWAIQHGVSVIPKSKTRTRIIENIDIFDFVLNDEDMEALDSLDDGFRTCWDPNEMH